jgi:hypothetical protein
MPLEDIYTANSVLSDSALCLKKVASMLNILFFYM